VRTLIVLILGLQASHRPPAGSFPFIVFITWLTN